MYKYMIVRIIQTYDYVEEIEFVKLTDSYEEADTLVSASRFDSSDNRELRCVLVPEEIFNKI